MRAPHRGRKRSAPSVRRGRLREPELGDAQQHQARSSAPAKKDRETAGRLIRMNEQRRRKGARFDWQSFVTIAAKFRMALKPTIRSEHGALDHCAGAATHPAQSCRSGFDRRRSAASTKLSFIDLAEFLPPSCPICGAEKSLAIDTPSLHDTPYRWFATGHPFRG